MILSACISGASNLVYNGFWLILDVSSFIGQNLVSQILVILSLTSRVLEVIANLLRVICKDSVIFFQDITEDFSCIITFIVENILNVRDGLRNFSSALIYGLATLPKLLHILISCLSSCVSSLTNFIKAILIIFWDGLLLIQSSLWLVVMRTPSGIFHCLKKLYEQLIHFLYSILMYFMAIPTSLLYGIQNIFHIIYELPCGSVFGSVSTIILLYLFIKNFKKLCIFLFKLFFTFYNYLSSLCRICIRQFLGRNSNNEYDVQYKLIADKLCVICQDGLKEVIIMPCRHLCLCVHCKRLIIQSHKVCPICRTNIEGMMKVYL